MKKDNPYLKDRLIKKICETWKDSRYGHYKSVQEKQLELSDLLEELYTKIIGKDPND